MAPNITDGEQVLNRLTYWSRFSKSVRTELDGTAVEGLAPTEDVSKSPDKSLYCQLRRKLHKLGKQLVFFIEDTLYYFDSTLHYLLRDHGCLIFLQEILVVA